MNPRTFSLLVIIGCAGLAACKPAAVPPAESAPAAPRPAVALTDELRPRLVAADTADGKVDHVVSKCIGCSLHMDGLPAHASVVGEYTVEFCSKSCQAGFAKDPAKATAFLATK